MPFNRKIQWVEGGWLESEQWEKKPIWEFTDGIPSALQTQYKNVVGSWQFFFFLFVEWQNRYQFRFFSIPFSLLRMYYVIWTGWKMHQMNAWKLLMLRNSQTMRKYKGSTVAILQQKEKKKQRKKYTLEFCAYIFVPFAITISFKIQILNAWTWNISKYHIWKGAPPRKK